LDIGFSGVILAPLLMFAAFKLLPAAGFPPDQFPVAAYSHLDPSGRLFAPDKFGGYLIYRSNGQIKVFFDGRSDLFGAEFLKNYAKLVQIRPGWRESWDGFHFTQALLPNNAPLIEGLKLSGWRSVYRDGTVTILEPGGT
jgi:hypothetical protein